MKRGVIIPAKSAKATSISAGESNKSLEMMIE
jgi:hypothetical protein